MRIGFVVNDIAEEEDDFTTPGLVLNAVKRGHEAWYFGLNDFTCTSDNKVVAVGRSPVKKHRTTKSMLEDVRGKDARTEKIRAEELDALILRNNPSVNSDAGIGTQSVALIFAELATRHNVIVLNDPHGLAKAMNKLYFQFFPEAVRPKTVISRNPDEIKAFIKEQKGKAVLKPLRGSGGQGVFLVGEDSQENLNQMIEAISRDGYIVAQEYLPAAAEGDVRFFMMNGKPLVVDGQYAAIRRVSSNGDMRSNISAGGSVKKAKITDEMLKLAELVRPKLVQDGMFLVGLDIAGDKLMEINVFSPGGLGPACEILETDFYGGIIDAVEQKVEYATHYDQFFDNLELSML